MLRGKSATWSCWYWRCISKTELPGNWKKRPAGNDLGDRPTKENRDQGRLAPDTTTRMYRGYTIGVRAETGNDTPDNKEDGNGDTTQVPVPEL
jgi:hypothetical protein